ncbi:MAG: hypothetical protein ACOYMK_14465 [Hyphomonadaceae bacterium]
MVVLLALMTGLSAWMTSSFAGAPAGYAAAYTTGGAFLFTCIFAVAGLVLTPWRQTRWFGLALLVSAVWLIGSYLGAINVLYKLDLVQWKGERMVSLLPELGNGYYIYFQQGTSDAQIESFSDRLLHDPPSLRGRDLKTGIRSYARLIPVDGREVIAIGLQSDLTSEQRRDLRLRLQSERIVAEVSDSSLTGRKR